MKQIFFLFILLCLLSYSIPGQSKQISKNSRREKAKYGVLFSNSRGNLYLNQKKHFVRFLKEQQYDYYKDSTTLILDKERDRVLMSGKYKVISVEEKTDNFYVQGNRLKRKILYLVDIMPIAEDDEFPCFTRILSFKDFTKDGKELIIGETYQFTLSYLNYDPIYTDDGQFIPSIRGIQRIESCYYKGVFIRFLNTTKYYYAESPNLNGVYYIDK